MKVTVGLVSEAHFWFSYTTQQEQPINGEQHCIGNLIFNIVLKVMGVIGKSSIETPTRNLRSKFGPLLMNTDRVLLRYAQLGTRLSKLCIIPQCAINHNAMNIINFRCCKLFAICTRQHIAAYCNVLLWEVPLMCGGMRYGGEVYRNMHACASCGCVSTSLLESS